MHDWSEVEAGLYQSFHQLWITATNRLLNRSVLPPDYYALPERQMGDAIPNVLTLQRRDIPTQSVATAQRPRARIVAQSDVRANARRSRIVIRGADGDVVAAVIEFVSPGNRDSRDGLQSFIRKAWHLLDHGIHLLIVDPFPPDVRAPHGLHAALFQRENPDSYQLPADQPLTQVAYECNGKITAYLEPLAVGQPLAEMPVFLNEGRFVELPLEQSYLAAWDDIPDRARQFIPPLPGG